MTFSRGFGLKMGQKYSHFVLKLGVILHSGLNLNHIIVLTETRPALFTGLRSTIASEDTINTILDILHFRYADGQV